MAERNEYSYNPIDLNADIAVGIKLPFGKPNGLFALSYTTEEQAISNLKNLILTKKGERVFQPEFGTSLPSLLFENMTEDLISIIEVNLRDDINFWLPYILIENIDVVADFDRNLVKVELSFRVTEQGANTTIIIFADSSGVVSVQ